MFAAQQPSLAVIASPAVFAGLRLAAYVRKNYSTMLPALTPLLDKINRNRVRSAAVLWFSIFVSHLSLCVTKAL
jgi:hypothetical protein